jgi:hypothetical protein
MTPRVTRGIAPRTVRPELPLRCSEGAGAFGRTLIRRSCALYERGHYPLTPPGEPAGPRRKTVSDGLKYLDVADEDALPDDAHVDVDVEVVARVAVGVQEMRRVFCQGIYFSMGRILPRRNGSLLAGIGIYFSGPKSGIRWWWWWCSDSGKGIRLLPGKNHRGGVVRSRPCATIRSKLRLVRVHPVGRRSGRTYGHLTS